MPYFFNWNIIIFFENVFITLLCKDFNILENDIKESELTILLFLINPWILNAKLLFYPKPPFSFLSFFFGDIQIRCDTFF